MEALAATQHGLITRGQAEDHGLSEKAIEHRLRIGRWHLLARGLYRLPGAVDTRLRRAMAAVLASGNGAAISHASAAALHALPGFSIEPLTVSVSRHGRRSLPRVRVEQSLKLPEHHLQLVDSVPCTTVARTLFDLCGDVHALRAERVLDTALARKLVTLPELWRVLDELAEHGRAGVVLLRTLLTERQPDYVAPESELEARFIALARRHGLPEPERQVDLGDGDSWIGRVDFGVSRRSGHRGGRRRRVPRWTRRPTPRRRARRPAHRRGMDRAAVPLGRHRQPTGRRGPRDPLSVRVDPLIGG